MNADVWSAVMASIQLAVATTVLELLIGVPLAVWLLRAGRWTRTWLTAILALPLVLPPTVLGFYLLCATSPHTLLGGWYRDWMGHPLPFSFAGILLGSVIFNLPFAVQPFVVGFSRVERKWVEAAECLGASSWRIWWELRLPLASPGLVAGLVLVFAHTLGEFGVVLMLGGNRPGVTRTMSIALYDRVQSLDYAAAHQLAWMLVAIGLIAVLWTSWLFPWRELSEQRGV